VEKIKAAKLPPKLEECVREYEKVGKRERFLWQNENSYSQFHFDIILNNAIISSIVLAERQKAIKKEENKKEANKTAL